MAKAPVNFRTLLTQVNYIREALAIGEGKLQELPKGTKGDAHHCVLAKALSNGWEASVGGTIELIHPADDSINTSALLSALRKRGFKNVRQRSTPGKPNQIRIEFDASTTMINFINRFDEGDFPDLILHD